MDLKVDGGEPLLELRNQRRDQIGINRRECADDEAASLRSVHFLDKLGGTFEFADRALRMITE